MCKKCVMVNIKQLNIFKYLQLPKCTNVLMYLVPRQDNSINSPRPSIRPAVKIRRSGPVLSCGPSGLLAWPCSDSRWLHLQPKFNRKAGTEQSGVIFFKCWYPIPCTLEQDGTTSLFLLQSPHLSQLGLSNIPKGDGLQPSRKH